MTRETKTAACTGCGTIVERKRIDPKVKCETCRVLWSVYKIHKPERDKILLDQDGGCGICGTQIRFDGKASQYSSACVDHCHDTGKVRGVLCYSCNKAIGMLGDNADGLRRALDYLEDTDE